MENLFGQRNLIEKVRRQVRQCKQTQKNVLEEAHTMRQNAIKAAFYDRIVELKRKTSTVPDSVVQVSCIPTPFLRTI